MKYLSICSGIESAGLGWHPLGFECVGLTEIDDFRSAVLQYHFPNVKNYGDFTKLKPSDISDRPICIVGGTPCATFSIAGLRKGLAEDRGNLALEFIKCVDRFSPKWVVWENVPGVLSSNEGKDLGTFLGALADIGYGFAYRVLDTQYIRTQRFPRALPQRRRRIFVVGCLGDWKSSAKVLFDQEAMSGNPPPGRKERSRDSRKFKGLHRGLHRKLNYHGFFSDKYDPIALQTSHTTSNGSGIKADGCMYSLTATDKHAVMCFEPDALGGHAGITKIRRLTIVECERLQGFSDNYTQVPYRGKPKEQAPISKRYEAVGRAMSVNVMEWLGTRINIVHNNEI